MKTKSISLLKDYHQGKGDTLDTLYPKIRKLVKHIKMVSYNLVTDQRIYYVNSMDEDDRCLKPFNHGLGQSLFESFYS